jgi:uncharacterized membrane protein HdeD (DUF308 family)
MSNADGPTELRPSAPAPEPRNGCLTALMVLAGIVMLLPGLCALIVGGLSLGEPHLDSSIISLVLLGLLVGVGGILLIRAAIRGPRS